MKHLRQYIRQILLQEGLHLDTSEDLALLVHTKGNETTYILFRFDKTMNFINKKLAGDNYVSTDEMAYGLVRSGTKDQVIGVLRCIRPYMSSHWGAAEVILSAAESGWGPTLYDTVMGEEPRGIMADRRQVSRAAYRIYDYYLQHRDDIEKKPLDSSKHQWTEDTFDDGQPGSDGRYNKYANPESQEQFLEDATCWVFDRDPVPQAAIWKKKGDPIIELLLTNFRPPDIEQFIRVLVRRTYEYYSNDD